MCYWSHSSDCTPETHPECHGQDLPTVAEQQAADDCAAIDHAASVCDAYAAEDTRNGDTDNARDLQSCAETLRQLARRIGGDT